MSDDTFSTEPVIGHHVGARLYEPNSELSEFLKEAGERLGIEPINRNRTRIEIEVSDVDWDETKLLSMNTDVFEELIEWYENQ